MVSRFNIRFEYHSSCVLSLTIVRVDTSSKKFIKYFLGTITRLLKSLRAIDELNLSLRQQIQLIRHERVDIDGEDEEEEVTKLMDQVITVVNNAPQHQFPYLQHPGHVIYFKKETETKDTKYVAIHEDSLAHPDRLYLLRNMLVDHKRTGYKLALDNLC